MFLFRRFLSIVSYPESFNFVVCIFVVHIHIGITWA
jgi:hypothetical protein